MAEKGKRERLRNGEAVELKPGLWGRLNKENRNLELDTGEILPVSKQDQRDLFPENESALDIARRTEKLESQVKKAPFGEFLYQMGQQGILNAPKDWIDYFTKTGDQYLADKEAQRRVSQRISKESPYTSGAATVASFVPDLMLTGGMSATKAAPLLTGISAGSRILSEPEEVGKEALVATGFGKFVDLGANALNKMASRRGASRALPGQQEAVRQSNIAGQQAVSNLNAAQTQNFNILKQNIKNSNDAILKKHLDELNKRQNDMIQAQAARDAQIVQLKNQEKMAKFFRNSKSAQLDAQYQTELALAKKEEKRLLDEFNHAKNKYEESLKQLPELQKKAQAEYSANIVKTAREIERSFPIDAKISPEEFGLAQFIDNNINKTGLAASKEGNQATRILNSLFPESETLGIRQLSKRYEALEDAIQRSTPEVQSVLNNFKEHLSERLPVMLENNLVYSRVIPGLKRQLNKDIEYIFKKIPQEVGFKTPSQLQTIAKENIDKYLSELTPYSLAEKVKKGELKQDILNKLLEVEDLFPLVGTGKRIKNREGNIIAQIGIPVSYKDKIDKIHSLIDKKLDKALAQAEMKLIGIEIDVAKKLGAKGKKTLGMAENIPPPQPPSSPQPVNFPTPPQPIPEVPPIQLPPPINPPPIPPKPSLMPNPPPPTPHTFTPQAEPTLAPAQGVTENLADLLEKNPLGGKGIVNNPIAKLAGLKYLLGGAALPAEIAYAGLKGLTSPTSAGQAARMTFKQSGIKAIESWAQKYPSYRNGILDNPQDRRSLTKEIEDDHTIPIEQKAVIQSKINRGKPIQEKL